MDDQQAREYYVKIKTLREEVDKLSEQLQEIDGKTLEIHEMIQAVKQADEIQAGDELLVPLTNGVFIKATAKENQELLLNVGADSVVKKTPKQTVTLLKEQQQSLTTFRQQVTQKREEVAKQAQEVEEEVTKRIQEDV